MEKKSKDSVHGRFLWDSKASQIFKLSPVPGQRVQIHVQVSLTQQGLSPSGQVHGQIGPGSPISQDVPSYPTMQPTLALQQTATRSRNATFP
jgi:hypothetical protein